MTSKQTRHIFFSCFLILFSAYQAHAAYQTNETAPESYISQTEAKGSFILSEAGTTAPLVLSAEDFPGVIRVAGYVQNDLAKVTGTKPELVIGSIPSAHEIIIAGTIGKSALIAELVRKKKIDISEIEGKWESTLTQVVEKPFPGVKRALVIVGSDKRGTIFGLFTLSKNIGVSPWYWWADVPIRQQKSLFVNPGSYLSGEPKVKYRGIFLNDEEPALGRWAVKNYGGFNHEFYEKVFELILRLKGNYLWPAMWWAAFNADDPQNPELADEMGVVMATSHHEPMMRAHAEWKPYGGKDWNYETNADQLRQFWEEGLERMGNRESVVTVGMRGDGDMAMSESTNIALLERIVADQRKIISEVTGKPAEQTPQVWALYKEVQDYYDKGMRVPDDVTLLLCDDNWGNIRKLPKPDARKRSGGYGIYYHFDYVGGPRNYKWLNTNPLPRVWEQMHMAYEYGVDRIWLVNVGDLKPMELPISFFLDYAWNPDEWPVERLPEYTVGWARQQFGTEHAAEIAEMLDLYTKYNGRRKPELLSPETYSLNNFREAETVVADYNELARQAEALGKKLPAADQDAYYQLVLHPITACANLNEMYFASAKNRQAAEQGRATTADWGEKVKQLFRKDADITEYYHTKLANGKWDRMMSQTHIGYTNWQQPEVDKMPEVKEISLSEKAEMGIAIDGSGKSWAEGTADESLPDLVDLRPVYIDIFNRGTVPFNYEITSDQPWIRIDQAAGRIEKERRIWISADWSRVPEGKNSAKLTIRQIDGKSVTVAASVVRQKMNDFKGFVESNGYISMEAAHFSRNIPSGDIAWKEIPGLGRTLSAMAVFPVKAPIQEPLKDAPRLEYDLTLSDPGEAEVTLFVSPSLNYFNDEGLKVAVSFDDQQPQTLAFNKEDKPFLWNRWVSDNIIRVSSKHAIDQAGKHTLKIRMVTPGVVIQKIVVNTGEKKNTYLGEPESARSDFTEFK